MFETAVYHHCDLEPRCTISLVWKRKFTISLQSGRAQIEVVIWRGHLSLLSNLGVMYKIRYFSETVTYIIQFELFRPSYI